MTVGHFLASLFPVNSAKMKITGQYFFSNTNKKTSFSNRTADIKYPKDVFFRSD